MSRSPHSNGYIPHDYHVHTNVSCDSEATMIEMGESALALGITEIAFTDHFDLHPGDSCTGFYKPDVFFANLDAARQALAARGLTIRAGVELGEPHRFHAAQQPVLAAWPYDVVLGSLHWVGDHLMFDRDYFRTHAQADVITRYFSELLVMVRAGGFDVLAHVDVFKRVAHEIYDHYDIADWEDYVRPIWAACIEGGIGIEVNAGALRRGLDDPHPALAGLRWYREMGGERLTLGSDGHRPAHVGYGLATALDVARAAGFTRVCVYERRQVARWREI